MEKYVHTFSITKLTKIIEVQNEAINFWKDEIKENFNLEYVLADNHMNDLSALGNL